MKTVAVVGLSGVGKSTMIRRAAQTIALLHLQASKLIKLEQEYRSGPVGSSEELRLGPVLENQALMLAAFSRLTEGVHSLVVFDGHTIIDGATGPISIPADVFRTLGCVRMIFLREEPQIIAYRRSADRIRIRPVLAAAQLGQHQELAEKAAQDICLELQIPLTIVDGPDQTTFDALLADEI